MHSSIHQKRLNIRYFSAFIIYLGSQMCNIVSNVTGPLRESLVVETEDEIKCDVCWAQLQWWST